MQQSKTLRRATYVMGIFLAFLMGASFLFPLIQQNQTIPLPTSTPIPSPTFPPPITDFSLINFNQRYLHSTGLYTVAVPEPPEWDQVSSDYVDGNRARVTMQSQFEVVEVSVETANVALTLNDLRNRFTTEVLRATWIGTDAARAYDNFQLMGPPLERDGRLYYDFQLGFRRQTYLARQASWTDGVFIYTVRVVTPENERELINFLLEGIIPTIQLNEAIAGTAPANWLMYFDSVDKHLLRYPNSWVLEDSAPGLPASIISTSATPGGVNYALRVESQAGITAGDGAAAGAWVQAARPNATIASTQPITRGEVSGFGVTYSFNDLDGNPQSGYAVLLNGGDGKLHTANLTISVGGVDLSMINPDDPASPYAEAARVMQTFTLAPTLDAVAVFDPGAGEPTPVPPTRIPFTPTPEVTAEATQDCVITPEATAPAEATGEATAAAEATAEATAQAEMTAAPEVTPTIDPCAVIVESTPEATAEATIEATVETTPEATTEATAEATANP